MTHVSDELNISADTWSDVLKLRKFCAGDETTALALLQEPRGTLNKLGVDIAFSAGESDVVSLAEILDQLSVSQRSDILRPILSADYKAVPKLYGGDCDPTTEDCPEDPPGETDPGIVIAAVVLIANAAVVVNVGGFVNAALVVNAGAVANVAAGVNVSTVASGYQDPTLGASADKDGIVVTEEFLVSELGEHLKSYGLSKFRQQALLSFAVEKFRTRVDALELEETRDFDFDYKGQSFSISVSTQDNGSISITNGSVLH